jgi:uncharacterized protein with HEPN domain
MDRDLKKYLWDVLNHIKFIEQVTAPPFTYQEFESNQMVIQSVERSFEIIGEAVKRALAIDPNLKISDTRKIIGMRNILAHGYDIVMPSSIWVTIKKSLPILKLEITLLLE